MDWYCIIGILIIFGIIGAQISNRKGNGSFVGFLAGCILGPIGLILVAVTGPNEEVLQEREQAKTSELVGDGQLRKCPFCAEYIQPEAKVCKHCQRDLPLPDKIHCPECDTLLELDDNAQQARHFTCPKCKSDVQM